MPSFFAGNWKIRDLNRQLISLLFCFLSLISHHVNACITLGEFDLNQITQTDAIYVGEVKKFEIVTYDDVFGRSSEYGLIDFEVKRSLKGEAHGNLKLFLASGNFGLPEEITVSKSKFIENSAIIATSGRSDYRKPTFQQRFENGAIFTHQPPILPQIASAPCSWDFILPFSPELEAAIRDSLRGKAVKNADEVIYLSPSELIGIKGMNRHQRSIAIHADRLGFLIFLFILLIVTIPTFIILWRKIKQRPF